MHSVLQKVHLYRQLYNMNMIEFSLECSSTLTCLGGTVWHHYKVVVVPNGSNFESNRPMWWIILEKGGEIKHDCDRLEENNCYMLWFGKDSLLSACAEECSQCTSHEQVIFLLCCFC